MARRATAIKEMRDRQPAILVLDTGNSLLNDQNPALSSQGATSIEVLNRLGYDAIALGERDLILGLDVLEQRMAEATFPVLSANVIVRKTDVYLTQPYHIAVVEGHRVGIIGLTGISLDTPSSALEVRDPLGSLHELLPEVVHQSELVIVLSNASLDVEREIARTLPQVQLIVSGGEEWLAMPEVGVGGGVLVHAEKPTIGHAGRVLGIARLAFDAEGRLITHAWQALTLGPEVADDPALADWVAGWPR